MATNGRKRYFHIDENASSEQMYALLDDVESADEDDIDNLMNDSDIEFMSEEETTPAASTQDTSLTILEANLHAVPSDNQSKERKEEERKEQKRRMMEVDQKRKSYQARRVSPRVRNTTQSKWNSFSNRNIFFVDRPRRAAWIDNLTIKPLC